MPEFDSVMVDNENRIIGAQDTVLLGRRMYDEWSQFWPTSDEEPFAGFINGVEKYVVTSTPLTHSLAQRRGGLRTDRGPGARPQGPTRR